MSRRKTVILNMDYVVPRIKDVFRHNVVFCEEMERGQNWVTEWKRNRNLPSPEEAARMCVLLRCTPEEMLVNKEDIALINELLERQKEHPTPSVWSGPVLPKEYFTLSDAHREAVDNLIRSLAKQSEG